MASTKINIAANFLGRIWIALMSIVFIPIYLRYLGIEVYGIIGIFASLQAILMLLDAGLSPTLNREIASLSAFPEKAKEMRNLIRTLEIPYLLLACLILLITFSLSPIIATYWIKNKTISNETLIQSFLIISTSFVFQWIGNFYAGGLSGLQKQVHLNAVNIIMATLRSVGAIIILHFVSPTIQAFLTWQLFITICNTLTIYIFFKSFIPQTRISPKFDSTLFKGLWKFAAGMTGITLVVLALTQTDKLILSKMLNLEQFGYYSLVSSVTSMALEMIAGSVGASYFPQFSQLFALRDENRLKQIYHQSSQVSNVLIIPTAIIFALFPSEILFVWTRNQLLVDNSSILMTLVAIGVGINTLMTIPYFMQLAHGITKITFWVNIFAVIFLIPSMIYTTLHYGMYGGVTMWAVLNFLHIVITMQVIHRYILKGELKKWYLIDVGLPMLTTIIPSIIIRVIFPPSQVFWYSFAVLFFATITALMFAAFSTPFSRNFILGKIKKFNLE
jgi:O-antigen/teichoic acid export membrane protein